jgi:hypothetical protein
MIAGDIEQMGEPTKSTLEPKQIDSHHPSPSLSPQDNELVARADERLAHAYEQIASADEQLARVNETLFRLADDDARHGLSSARDRPALRGAIGLLLAGCIFAAAFAAQSSYGDAARRIILRWYPQFAAPSLPRQTVELAAQRGPAAVQADAAVREASLAQPTAQDTVPPVASISPELAQMLQSTSHDLANLQQSTEQMKTRQEQNAHDIARVSEQLKAAQAQIARDNANAAEQLRTLHERIARLTTAASEQNVRPKASGPPTSIAAPRPKPLPALPSPQARAQPLAPVELRPAQQ